MSSNLFFFLEGGCLGLALGSGLCLWVMWQDKMAMMREYDKIIDSLEKEIADAMKKMERVIERGIE